MSSYHSHVAPPSTAAPVAVAGAEPPIWLLARREYVKTRGLQQRLAFWAGLVGTCLSLGCGSPARETAAPKAAPAAAPPQAGYCERLQPLLDQAVRAARIGTELTCLDMPNVTELGWFGGPKAGEEANLRDCFDQPTQYEGLVQAGEPSFELAIADAFSEELGGNASLGLSSLLPWLPRVTASATTAHRLTARVTIREARFVTLVGVASRLQGQSSETRCLSALCQPSYSYVQKVLVGVPTVTLSAEDVSGRAVNLGVAVADIGFADRSVAGGARELRSQKPVTLAVARSNFRTSQTARLCEFCGKRGQNCCASEAPCDGGLGCVANRCAEVGGPGQPCDGSSCSGGATCVAGTCQLSCGGRGQPCCAGAECSAKLKCAQDPENSAELLVAKEDVRVAGGLLGTDEDRLVGGSSCGPLKTRTRFAISQLGGGRGNCDMAWWFDPMNDKDCRVNVHFEVSPLSEVQCHVEAFAYPPRKPDLCQ